MIVINEVWENGKPRPATPETAVRFLQEHEGAVRRGLETAVDVERLSGEQQAVVALDMSCSRSRLILRAYVDAGLVRIRPNEEPSAMVLVMTTTLTRSLIEILVSGSTTPQSEIDMGGFDTAALMGKTTRGVPIVVVSGETVTVCCVRRDEEIAAAKA